MQPISVQQANTRGIKGELTVKKLIRCAVSASAGCLLLIEEYPSYNAGKSVGQWQIQARASAALGKWRFTSLGPLEERIWSFSCIKPCCIEEE